ncbi:hypothetical protein P7228_11960 [Altererythrobacter arenosus]|uniref:Uncharacterized protein n=1 Tax=Altererythrobacter arenosus TaxID=3032592 RepID=A0ABY8FNW0_9SPHN|nr:hypothetical protein [Altererythrobacter sp. CAU 1644]WFL76708.1 hypothetical protein P7228_11960 [Altererythrobacter sp. CAU 1644]
MSVDPLEFIPGYVSPLTEKDHARIGRIAILWGQVEHFVEAILPHVTGLSWGELDAIKVTDKPIASKVDLLSQARNRVADEELCEQIREFCAAINETKVQRNHLFHGVWGWRATNRTKTVVPAARKSSNPEQPLKAAQLPSLEKKLCRCSRLGSDLVMHFHREGYRVKYTRYLHHDGHDIEAWLQQWTERNPLDDVDLDRSSSPGRLPYLEHPYPQK